jgi:hypothetical protein
MNIERFRALAHRKEDAMFQQNRTMRGHSPLNHVRPSTKRAAFEVALKEKNHLAEGCTGYLAHPFAKLPTSPSPPIYLPGT